MGVHAALLSLRLAAPAQFDRLFKDTPLDVILVNTRLVSAAPDKAQALAQTQLAGGGEQRSGRAASPLPSAATTTAGDSADAMQKQMASLQKQQALLLAQVKDLLAQLPPPQPKKADPAQEVLEEKRRQLLKLLAEIEQRIDQDNARPRKHYISPATREAAYAQYYDALRRKIEERGTLYFPERGGQKLYGELTMVITVNTDGRVLSTEVVQGSGQADLDRRAQAIATSAGPFGGFTQAMRQQADQLAVVSRFIFSRNNTLQTRGGEGAP
ncbi:energy transducer TonB [Limnohabitans sp.]|uniref:energy transducer TonB n=1 Tax=Limnohabitans sp. TaxID=1907725 RepID=UPI0038B96ADE